MEQILIPALIALAGVFITALGAFLGILISSRTNRDLTLITQGQQAETKRAEIAVTVERVEVDKAKLVVDGFEHLADRYQRAYETALEEIARLKDEVARAERRHRDELEPLRRYAAALRKAEDEQIFQIDLVWQAKQRVEAQGGELVRLRRELREARFWATQMWAVYRDLCATLRVLGEKDVLEAKPPPPFLLPPSGDAP